MNVDGKVIAIVGPNEAGKTSFLDALEHLESEESFEDHELTRRADFSADHVVVEALYLLDSEDREELAHLNGAPTEHGWFTVQKQRDGEILRSLDPRPRRDIPARKKIAATLRKLLRSSWLKSERQEREGEEPSPLADSSISQLLTELGSNRRQLSDQALESFRSAVGRLKELEGGPHYAAAAITRLEAHYDVELEDHPSDQAAEILEELRPPALSFSEDARDLQFEYDISAVAGDPPEALANLAGVAQLDLWELRQQIRKDESGEVARLLEDANEQLKAEYAVWSQSGVRPQLALHERSTLRIHVSNEGGGYMKFNERSEGQRAFVALVASATASKRGIKPILMVDEAELHLHYDAQADLVEVFQTQDAVAQIIYSTHSAGCLPEDLGSGVRIISPIKKSNHSQIINKFWSIEPGFSPLLLGMGASTLAFFPTRDAVVSEGPTELVMLGSLLREAIGEDSLGFQIVPGSANVRPTSISGLDLQARNMAWLVDGDEGGRRIVEKKLEPARVPRKRIVYVGGAHSGLVIEDLVHPETYVQAINEEIGRRGASARITVKDVGRRNRPDSVKQWCVEQKVPEPDKVAVAHHVVELGSTKPLVDPTRSKAVQQLHARLAKAIASEKRKRSR